MIISFAGIPGSGKTTIAYLLMRKLSDGGLRVRSGNINNELRILRVLRKTLEFTRYLVLHPINSFRLITECRKIYNGLLESGKDVFNILYLLSRYSKALKSSRGEVWVFDQGLLQASWSVAMYGGRYPELFSIFEGHSKERVCFVAVQVAPILAKLRLEFRKDQGSRVQKSGNKIADIEKGEKVLELLLNNVEDMYSTIRVENNDDIGNAINGLLQQLSQKYELAPFMRDPESRN